MAIACALCARPVPDGFLCSTHTTELIDDLTEIGELLAELEITRTRQDRIGESSIRRSSDSLLPWKENAAEAYWVLAVTTLAWTRIVLDKLGSDPNDPVGPIASTWTAWLIRRVKRIRILVVAGDCATEIGSAVDLARVAIDRPPVRIYVGPCEHDRGALGPCPVDLWAFAHCDTVECPDCETEHVLVDRRKWLLAKAHDHLVPLPTVARALSSWMDRTVTQAQLRGYVHRERLLSKGIDRAGTKLYRLGDAADVVIEVWRAQNRAQK